MNKKKIALASFFTTVIALGGVGFAGANGEELEVTIQNVSNTIITPPIIAVGQRPIDFFEVGMEASPELEQLAEGGDTTPLKDLVESSRTRVTQLDAPIPPGESITVKVPGWRRGFVSIAGMLLPTNDAFIATEGLLVRGNRTATAYLNSYDSGTEANTELEAHIPGPFGGEGYNSERDDLNIVHPHAGLHGNGDISAQEYNWGDPVAKVTVKVVR